jgi:ketosteroid isomerase-like protein
LGGADWEELEETPEAFIDAGEHLFVTVHHKGRGSGIEIADRTFHVYTFRDGKIVRKVELTERSGPSPASARTASRSRS